MKNINFNLVHDTIQKKALFPVRIIHKKCIKSICKKKILRFVSSMLVSIVNYMKTDLERYPNRNSRMLHNTFFVCQIDRVFRDSESQCW